MIIATQQLEALGAPHKEAFIVKTIAFLQEKCTSWTTCRSDQDLRAYVLDGIQWNATFGISSGEAIRQILWCCAKHDIMLPLEERWQAILSDTEQSELGRAAIFCNAVEANVIDLLVIDMQHMLLSLRSKIRP